MPLHDVGYRSWDEQKTPQLGRWFIIALTGIRLAFRSTWLNRTLILAWVPALVVGVWFFIYEQSAVDVDYRRIVQGLVVWSGSPADLAQAVITDPEGARHKVWSSFLLIFFRYPQSILMLVVIGLIAPKLISADLRNRGYLLYFSRPIHLGGYVLGKCCVIWAFLALITTLPALALYVIGLSLSPDMSVIFDTWDLPIRILVASLVLMIPTASVALACSAMTIESRYAAFTWFALWILGWVSYSVLRVGELAGRGPPRPPRGARFSEGRGLEVMEHSQWEILSPYHVLGRVQQYVFGLYSDDHSIIPYVAVLVVVTLVSIWFVTRQLQSRLRA